MRRERAALQERLAQAEEERAYFQGKLEDDASFVSTPPPVVSRSLLQTSRGPETRRRLAKRKRAERK